MLSRFNSFIEKYSGSFLIILFIWILFGPFLLTHYSIIDFTKTGPIGDTIGGITAPVIGLFSILLLYITLIKQIEKNKSDTEEANFRILYSEVEKLEASINSFQFRGEYGNIAITRFSISFQNILTVNQHNDSISEEDLESFNKNILRKFIRLFYLKNNLKTSLNYRDFIERDINENFNKAKLHEAYFKIVKPQGLLKPNFSFWVTMNQRDLETVFSEILEMQTILENEKKVNR